MLSALRGRSGSTNNLSAYDGLQCQQIIQRCSHVISCTAQLPLKDLHQFFPFLLSNIFGFDGAGGWCLRSFSRVIHSDFAAVLAFLAPGGSLFELIARLESEGFIYEFPTSLLPRPSRLALSEGVVPGFYVDKVQLSMAVDNSPPHLLLSALEYYFFHFAYYLIVCQTSQPFPPAVPLPDSLYSNLLDSLLTHYLPIYGPIPPALASHDKQGSPIEHAHLYHSGAMPTRSNQSGFLSSPPPPPHSHPHLSHPHHSHPHRSHSFGLLKTNGTAPGPHSHPHPLTPHTLTPAHSTTTVGSEDFGQTDMFMQVLVEFWLNQNVYDVEPALLSQAQNQVILGDEHLLLLRRVIKHVHFFSHGASYYFSSTSSPLTPLIPHTEELRSSILPGLFRRPLYHFLRYSFKHSPLDANFRYVLEVWLTYIQPWRYVDPAKPAAENKASLCSLTRKWRAFVLEHLPFYSVLLMEFLGRCFQLDLTSDPGVSLVYRVAKVFAQPNLMEFIYYGESLLLSSSPSSPRGSPPGTGAGSLKALLNDLEGPTFIFAPVHDDTTVEAVQSLLDVILHARQLLAQKTASLNPPLPHLHTSQPSSSPPSPASPLLPASPARAAEPRRSWMGSVWNQLSEFFSDAPLPFSSPHTTATNPQKLMFQLESAETNLRTMFKLPPSTPSRVHPSHLHPSRSMGGSPTLGRALPPSPPHSPHLSSSPPPPPHPLTPEYVEGSAHLTNQGKMQLIQGSRKSSGLDVQYLGDPLLQPIRSFENATLVRTLYRLSSRLSHRFAHQLVAVWISDRLVCRLLCRFLSPPPPPAITASPLTQHSQDSGPLQTPAGRVSRARVPPPGTTPTLHPSLPPRVNLRPLASYYAIAWILFCLFFAFIFFPTVWLPVVVLCMLPCCYQGNRRKTWRD